MASTMAEKRLLTESKRLRASSPQYITACPHPKNILEWYYCVEGPPGTYYEGGFYVGTVTFPSTYPFAPPSIRMLTPSGRFEINRRLCLSISDYHPESWNPIWDVEMILVGLLSFMVTENATKGSISSSVEEKRRFVEESQRLFDPNSDISKSCGVCLSRKLDRISIQFLNR